MMVFKKNFLVLFFIFLFSKTISAQQDTLSILHITDLHLMFNLESFDANIVHHREYTRGYKNANLNFTQFMQTVPEKTNSDMVIATGDMIDFFEAKTPGGKTLAYQVEQFARFLDDFHFPIFLTIGNHEIFSYKWQNDKVAPNQYNAGRARATWIRNFDCFKEGTYYSRVYKVGETSYRLIFLDNGFYQFLQDEKVINPYVDKPQLHWLREELTESDDDFEIILMHIPFTETSVLPESSNELYSILTQYPSIKLILTGHRHRNAVSRFPAMANNEIIQVETDALVETPKNWSLVQLTEKDILVFCSGEIKNEIVIPIK